ncbi:class I SAM-dependent methyltransferase [Aestuariimicrobium ganziense]|uniref:class I SAM-dependent methyltransferase n=1 Tax=Aestuariimicrobium ganziense TaxID=2773677 RepID=UPI0019435629|nr:class I SAM-dependent methyltransferase [Aestuariimicrobium ganziense]
MPTHASWADYLADFHAMRTGITEDVLSRAIAGNHTPYQWLARAVSSSATTVVDLACGSGAMTRKLVSPGRAVVGIDISEPELREARARSTSPFVLADARQLPLRDESADAVVSSMGLAVVHRTGDMLAEVTRVLRPGGLFAATVPTWRPINRTDMMIGGRLAAILRTPPRFPAHLEVSIETLLTEHGLRKVEDARERYRFTVTTAEDAELLIRGLYLPTVGPLRVKAAAKWLADEAERRGQVEVPIPMRRLVAIK